MDSSQAPIPDPLLWRGRAAIFIVVVAVPMSMLAMNYDPSDINMYLGVLVAVLMVISVFLYMFKKITSQHLTWAISALMVITQVCTMGFMPSFIVNNFEMGGRCRGVITYSTFVFAPIYLFVVGGTLISIASAFIVLLVAILSCSDNEGIFITYSDLQSMLIRYILAIIFVMLLWRSELHVQRINEKINQLRDMWALKKSKEMADRAKVDFLMCISHDLRSPIAVIGSAVEVLEPPKTSEEDNPLRSAYDIVFDAIDILQVLVNDLIYVSRMEAAHGEDMALPLDPAPTDVRECCRLVCQMISARLKAREKNDQVKLITHIEEDIEYGTRYLCDVTRLQQVLMNILTNAVKFTASGTITITVRTGIEGAFPEAQSPNLLPVARAGTGVDTPSPNAKATIAHDVSSLSDLNLQVEDKNRAPASSPTSQRHFAGLRQWLASPNCSQLSLRPREGFGLVQRYRTWLRRVQERRANKQLGMDSMVTVDTPEELVEQRADKVDVDAHEMRAAAALPAVLRMQRLEFIVEDTGFGISKEQQHKLFQKFYQTDSGRTHGGTGIGLYIVNNLAQRMGGRAFLAHSEIGKGSTFVVQVELPVVDVTALEDSSSCSPDVVDGDENEEGDSSAPTEEMPISAPAALQPGVNPLAGPDTVTPVVDQAEPPVVIPTITPTETPDGKSKPKKRKRRTKKCHVLLVDDNKHLQFLYAAHLKAAGHRVDSAFNGQECLMKVLGQGDDQSSLSSPLPSPNASDGETSPKPVTTLPLPLSHRPRQYDMIFLDAQMPVLDGFETVLRIRDHEQEHGWTATPIVMLTGHVANEFVQKIVSAGVCGYLPKPIKKSELLQAVTTRGQSAQGAFFLEHKDQVVADKGKEEESDTAKKNL